MSLLLLLEGMSVKGSSQRVGWGWQKSKGKSPPPAVLCTSESEVSNGLLLLVGPRQRPQVSDQRSGPALITLVSMSEAQEERRATSQGRKEGM